MCEPDSLPRFWGWPVKHYVLLHQDGRTAATVCGVFHEPTAPIAAARAGAHQLNVNTACKAETVSVGREIFRATYGIEGECFRVEGIEPAPEVLLEGFPVRPPSSSAKAADWIVGILRDLLTGDWELIEAIGERDHITQANPGSPFLGRFPGPNLYYSLHLRLSKDARALLDLSRAGYESVRDALKDED